MNRNFCVFMLTTFLCGCGPAPQDEAASQAETLSGKQAYDIACAQCHDEGLDGAPRISARDAWKDRSMLWQAVLFEHAKSGYLDMPAKGGNETLDDAAIARAAEYLLSTTFPEIKKD